MHIFVSQSRQMTLMIIFFNNASMKWQYFGVVWASRAQIDTHNQSSGSWAKTNSTIKGKKKKGKLQLAV